MKKIGYVSAALVAVGVLSLGMLAFAQVPPSIPPGQNATGTHPIMMQGDMHNGQSGLNVGSGMSIKHSAPPIVLTIDANGHALVRGTLVSVAGTVLTIKSWGLQFTVETSNAQIGGTATNISGFVAGDIIGIQGMLDQNNSGAITAATVRDWGTSQGAGTVKGLGEDSIRMMGGMMGDHMNGTSTPSSTPPCCKSDNHNGMMPPPIHGAMNGTTTVGGPNMPGMQGGGGASMSGGGQNDQAHQASQGDQNGGPDMEQQLMVLFLLIRHSFLMLNY